MRLRRSQRDFVVAGDVEFVGVRMGAEPGEGVIEFVVCARLGEVTCVDENVAFLGDEAERGGCCVCRICRRGGCAVCREC